MDLPKAIELLSESANQGMTTFDQDFKDAQRLGIEAQKAIIAWRKDWDANRLYLLPGETPPSLLPPPPAKIYQRDV